MYLAYRGLGILAGYVPFVGPFTSGLRARFDSAANAVAWWVATTAALVVLPSGAAWPSPVPTRYSDVALSAEIALTISVVWPLAVGCRPLGAKTSDGIRTIVRYALAFVNLQRANGDQEIGMVAIDRPKRILGNVMMPFQGDSGDFWARFRRGGDPDTSLKYEFADDGTLTLEGRFRGASVTARLVRQSSEEFPLLHRRFDWRNNDLWYWR